jgi:hypothetical protein
MVICMVSLVCGVLVSVVLLVFLLGRGIPFLAVCLFPFASGYGCGLTAFGLSWVCGFLCLSELVWSYVYALLYGPVLLFLVCFD